MQVSSGLLDAVGAWMDSDVQGVPVDELLGVAVERPALDQLEVPRRPRATSAPRVHTAEVTGSIRIFMRSA